MIVEKYRRPILFYGFSTAFSWTLWFVAAYIRHLTPAKSVYVTLASILGFIGLISPMIVAFFIVVQDNNLRNDLLKRFSNNNAG